MMLFIYNNKTIYMKQPCVNVTRNNLNRNDQDCTEDSNSMEALRMVDALTCRMHSYRATVLRVRTKRQTVRWSQCRMGIASAIIITIITGLVLWSMPSAPLRASRIYHAKSMRARGRVRDRACATFFPFLSGTTTVREVNPYKVTIKAGPATLHRHRHRRRRRRRLYLLSIESMWAPRRRARMIATVLILFFFKAFSFIFIIYKEQFNYRMFTIVFMTVCYFVDGRISPAS